MTRRAHERSAGHGVLVVHPARDEQRPCLLTLSDSGVVLLGAGAERTVLLRVPWWAVEDFSTDGTAPGPDGAPMEVLGLCTDAGVLRLLCTPSSASLIQIELEHWARRWEGARRPLARTRARLGALASARLCTGARRAAAALAGTRRGAATVLASALSPFARPLSPVAQAVTPAAAPLGRLITRRPLSVAVVGLAVVLWGAFMVAGTPSLPGLPAVPRASASEPGFDAGGMARLVAMAEANAGSSASDLAPASAPPPPAPPSVTDAPALSSHEVLGFVPYWALGSASGIDVDGFTTLSYFSLTANATGTLQESGTGWDGYESQDFADLVSRAHAAGDRVVLTVNQFFQSTLNAITSSPTAQATLATQIVAAVEAKNLDGVNIDFEGQGTGDQAGLTELVNTVAVALKEANPHYQLTMDTYSSSAGDPYGFYDIPALARVVDGFFVMSYDLNLDASPNAGSPITSGEFSDKTAASQYAAVVPASKIILGTSYYGYTWPTTNGTMAAVATGTPVPTSYAQAVAGGHPIYWDDITNTAWTSYEVGTQWYETYFQDPASVYLVAQLAATYDLAGVGAWALGMDGNSQAMTAALDGNAPVERAGPAGPAATSQSVTTTPSSVATPVTVEPGDPTTAPSSTTTTTATRGSGTTTTAPTGGGGTTYRTSGIVDGVAVALSVLGPGTTTPSGTGTHVGTLTGFTTTDPALSCLATGGAPALEVWSYPGSAEDWVRAQTPSDCVTATFTFPASALSGSTPGGGQPTRPAAPVGTAGPSGSLTADE